VDSTVNAEVKTAVREGFPTQEPDLRRGGIFNLVPRWYTCPGFMLKNNDTTVE